MSVLRISENDAGERLDLLLARLSGITRTQAQRLISSGAVSVNGLQHNKHYRVRVGDRVEYELPEPLPAEPEPQDIPVKVLYQDSDLAVVYKPAGMVVHPASGHSDGTLVNALLFSLHDLSGIGGVLRPGIVHRLDRDTSGLMIIAKTDTAHVRLQEMVKDRTLKRRYMALVHGVPATSLGTIDAPVGRDPSNRKKMAVTSERGRPATTHFEVKRTYKGASLLDVELITGRTHQIRVHLAYIGHPVAGDGEYGIRGELEKETGLERQFLHAYKISFSHPSTAEKLVLEEPLPEDLESALRKLENV